MKKTLNFKNEKDYRKWLAYGHIHGDFASVPGNKLIFIGGKKHKVKHSRKKESRTKRSNYSRHTKIKIPDMGIRL